MEIPARQRSTTSIQCNDFYVNKALYLKCNSCSAELLSRKEKNIYIKSIHYEAGIVI